MGNKQKIIIVVTLICLMVSCLVLASCQTHKHVYQDEWRSDETYHWRRCTICPKIVNKAKHTVDANGWTVVVEPTATQAGQRSGICAVCEATVTEEIEKLEHQHAFSADYLSDDVGHWKECACGEKSEFAVHEVTNWNIDNEPTETELGQKSGQCDVCHKNITATIPAVGREHEYSDELTFDDTYHFYVCVICGDKKDVALHEYPEQWQHNATKHWKQCECGCEIEEAHTESDWIIDKPATTTETGSKHTECVTCQRVIATETIDKLTLTTRTVDLYAINDFHGEVSKISSVGGYLVQQRNSNANTVLINSGDMFQGSMESNSNYGKLLTDCMDEIGFDAFAFGNHEFDWGLDKLETLAQDSDVPFLGANIYHWNASSKTWGTFASELAQEYVIKELDNGLKVGIIGIIGKDQITSISSNLVQTIGFKEPLPIIKKLASELRQEQGCDVVVVSAHVGPQGLVGETENNEEPSSAAGLEQYVDAVFCAHTHRAQVYTVDGLPFIQGGSNGSKVSHITLSVNPNGNVTCTAQENVNYSSSWPNIKNVNTLIDNSNEQIKDERNQVVISNLGSTLNKSTAVPRLVSRAIAEYAKNQGYDISLAMVNTARDSLSSGKVTYSNLYEAIPFDNEVYIAKVKGSEIINEVNYGVYFWRSSGEAIESNKYYTIAIIDYLLFHQNDSRDYNYFRSAFTSGFTPVALTNSNYDVYNYRLITRDYLLANSIAASDYTTDNANTDTTLLASSVTLKYETVGSWDGTGGGSTTPITPDPNPSPSGPTHAGTLADPYDVADAILLGADYTVGYQAPSIYVRCTVSNVTYIKQSDSSGDLGNFYVKDENGNSIKVYYVSKSSSSANKWASTEDLKVGDVLIMYVASYVYNGSTPQLGYGYCVSINGQST